MKKVVCALLLVMPVTYAVAAASSPEYRWQAAPSEQLKAQLTIKEAILRAFARNPKIAQAAAQIRVGKANLEEAQSAWFPQVSLQGNLGRSHRTDSAGSLNNNGSGGVTLKQLLYDFGKTGGSIEEQHNLSDAWRYELYNALNDVGMQTLQAYLQVKRYQTLVQAARANIDSLNSVSEMANLRAEAGLSSQSDGLQAQSRIAGMNASLAQYEAQMHSARAALSVLTGVISENLPDLPEDLMKQNITLDALPYESNNLVRSAQAKQLAAEQRDRKSVV